MLDNKPSISIGVSIYEAVSKTMTGKRHVIFTCPTAQNRDKWYAAIEYLKTKSIYDSYSKSNALVNFMSLAAEEEKKDEE